MNIHDLVDTFVEKVNAQPLCFPDYAPDVSPEQVPADGRISRATEDRAVLVQLLEEQLRYRFPEAFRNLLRRYTFPPFDVADVTFFGWNDVTQHLNGDLSHAIFNDEVMSRVLLAHGLIQIGRPDSGSYDAICFDVHDKYAIVQVEHENVLQREKIVVIDKVAPSFRELMRAFIKN